MSLWDSHNFKTVQCFLCHCVSTAKPKPYPSMQQFPGNWDGSVCKAVAVVAITVLCPSTVLGRQRSCAIVFAIGSPTCVPHKRHGQAYPGLCMFRNSRDAHATARGLCPGVGFHNASSSITSSSECRKMASLFEPRPEGSYVYVSTEQALKLYTAPTNTHQGACSHCHAIPRPCSPFDSSSQHCQQHLVVHPASIVFFQLMQQDIHELWLDHDTHCHKCIHEFRPTLSLHCCKLSHPHAGCMILVSGAGVLRTTLHASPGASARQLDEALTAVELTDPWQPYHISGRIWSHNTAHS